MLINKRHIDKVSIIRENERGIQRVADTISLADKFTNDPDKKERKQQCLCKTCYYISGRIGGNAICEIECALCSTEMMFSNTNVDILCKECAGRTALCKHCGADMEYINRRNREW